jgi:hypothetical protein
MLNDEDRRAIDGLFDRVAEAQRRAPDRDRDAEALIADRIARQPAAPYYLAQTVIVQQQALDEAQMRIDELEAQLRGRQGGGLFGGLFDRNGSQQQQRNTAPQRRGGPWDRDNEPATYGRRGGGFLEGAAQTALGVAGGVLLGNAIGSMFGAGEAHASDNSATDTSNDQGDTGASSDGGSDWGGGDSGDFDVGGDF